MDNSFRQVVVEVILEVGELIIQDPNNVSQVRRKLPAYLPIDCHDSAESKAIIDAFFVASSD
jgi:hypothetical protein